MGFCRLRSAAQTQDAFRAPAVGDTTGAAEAIPRLLGSSVSVPWLGTEPCFSRLVQGFSLLCVCASPSDKVPLCETWHLEELSTGQAGGIAPCVHLSSKFRTHKERTRVPKCQQQPQATLRSSAGLLHLP